MGNVLEPYEVYEYVAAQDEESDMEAWKTLQAQREWSIFTTAFMQTMFPRRLFLMLAVSAFFIGKYYFEHCDFRPDGSWVAKDLHYPKGYSMPILSFLFQPFPAAFPVEVQS